MAWFAVYLTATGELDSVGQVVADPLPAGKTSVQTPFSDGTSTGDRPGAHVWVPARLRFEPAPAPDRPSPEQQSDALRDQAAVTWTTVDLANALKLLLARLYP